MSALDSLPRRIVVLSGGIGGARFLEGVRDHAPEARITAVVNTADDIWLFGLRVCPDLDSVMYTLGGGIDPQRRWGRAEETWSVKAELALHHVEGSWFGLGDRDLATHLVRTIRMSEGCSLTAITEELCRRWQPGIELLPMSDDEVETHLRVGARDGEEWLHLQEWWIRHRGEPEVRELEVRGAAQARPAPGVVEAISGADAVLLAPSNPVVSIGPVLGVPGIAEALRTTAAPVVGVSPIIAGSHVRGMANQLLAGLGMETSAAAVAEGYGSRAEGGHLDAWLVDDDDVALVPRVEASGLRCGAVPLLMTDASATDRLVGDALALAAEVGRR